MKDCCKELLHHHKPPKAWKHWLNQIISLLLGLLMLSIFLFQIFKP
ncbi:hypothetical protein FHS56_001320 [Thermonema lapsum]|uniref:Uncharacterized protein n=1 Tax=Thermonema lapsum TaxID=28195 RepID=A0A846MRB5_9BACT|nr:hypothetical protein [Thermonema lapsum]NIK73807.1 hypothetical protein [Thermonema lapsum]